MRVIAGPATIGNVFGYYGHKVPAGRWVLAINGEYANGGRGPCEASERFSSLADAEAALAARQK